MLESENIRSLYIIDYSKEHQKQHVSETAVDAACSTSQNNFSVRKEGFLSLYITRNGGGGGVMQRIETKKRKIREKRIMPERETARQTGRRANGQTGKRAGRQARRLADTG